MTYDQNGSAHAVELAWQYCRNQKQAQAQLPVPFSALVTPLAPIPGLQRLEYAPTECRKCKAYLNCHCQLDLRTTTWLCPFWCGPLLHGCFCRLRPQLWSAEQTR